MERNYAIDFIKTVAILSVITIHISTAFLDRATPFSFNFDTLLLVNQFSRFAVPLFFASSGFLLALKYQDQFPTLPFYKKRILRIIPPYLFWTLVYYCVISPHSLKSIFSITFLDVFLTGSASYQLYFIPAIFILYLLFPFLIKFKTFFLSKTFLLSFFIFSCILLAFVYYPSLKPPIYSPLRVTLYNLFPFLIGMYIALNFQKASQFFKKYFAIFLLGMILSGLTIFSESLLLFKNFPFDRFLRDQWRPTVMTYSLFSGVVFANAYERYLQKHIKQILFLSRYSFGVFFIHVAILELFLEITDMNKLYGLPSFIIVFLGTITLSYGVIYMLSKIPKVGKIISAS